MLWHSIITEYLAAKGSHLGMRIKLAKQIRNCRCCDFSIAVQKQDNPAPGPFQAGIIRPAKTGILFILD